MTSAHRMSRLRRSLLTLRDLLLTAGPVGLIAVGLIVLAYWWLDPTPPRSLVLATGPAQGAYAEFGQRYARALAQHGITVELRPTKGSSDNLTLLQNGEVDAAFVQGGIDTTPPPELEDANDELASLGSLFREPVWVFYREAAARAHVGRTQLDSLAQMKRFHIDIGHQGSGVGGLMRRLLNANGLDAGKMKLSRLEPTPAVVELLAGRLDALAFVSAPEAPMVQLLLITPGIRLLDFAQAEAYARRVPQVSPALLPRGVINLARDLPREDVRLVATTATLVVRDATHPALQHLLVEAAQKIHSPANWFQRKGEFPQAAPGDFALSDEADRYWRKGPTWLQRWMPFWLANLLDRMWVVVLSILAALIPLSRVIPPLYALRIRRRIFRWYGLLRGVEEDLASGRREPAALLRELEQIETRLEKLHVPLAYTDQLYALRGHIQLVRKRILARPAGVGQGEEAPGAAASAAATPA
ncbi:MAG: hypothetical protein RLZZ584_2652 [Pseudomonadota bacterium]|jgi:TRAP-type uncharacterized transport system substrate-binding protein